ncbi:hypothetical protein BGZ96_008959, partial [Linnemannia gamsii]
MSPSLRLISEFSIPTLDHKGASLAINNDALDVDGDGGWDLDADLTVELNAKSGAIVAEDSSLEIPVAGQSKAEIWHQNSPLAANHIAAEAFESAMQHFSLVLITIVTQASEADEALLLLGECRKSILGFSIELNRHEGQSDASPAGVMRMLELAAYVTGAQLQPKHMTIVAERNLREEIQLDYDQ